MTLHCITLHTYMYCRSLGMLNTPGDMSAKPLGKGRGQHGRQRWLAKKSADMFCQAVWPTYFARKSETQARHNPDTTQTPQGKVRHNPDTTQTQPRHKPDTTQTQPTHNPDTSQTQPTHNPDTTQTQARHNPDTSQTQPKHPKEKWDTTQTHPRHKPPQGKVRHNPNTL